MQERELATEGEAHAAGADSLVAKVCEAIERGIREGRYLPGVKLIEHDLAKAIGVSRNPVREAFRQLAAQRILEIRPRRGTFVRRLTRTEAFHVLNILTALGRLAISEAARRIDVGTNREELRTMIAEEQSRRSRDRPVKELLEVSYPFHQLIARISGNPLLLQMNHQLQMQMYRLASDVQVLVQTQYSTVDDHKAIADAILAGDAHAALAAYEVHEQHTRAALESLPPSAFERE
jgi:DNA-binding GntR family transcriptional regulator